MAQADIGLIGLAVMGQNLALNMNDHGYTVAVYNRSPSKTDALMAGPGKNSQLQPAFSLQELVSKLKRPRRIMLMIKAGEPVDAEIEQLLPFLEAGDIIIDGGNSLYTDTIRRCKSLKKQGIIFLGVGISGGEEGARHGPSIMPGGNPDGWPHVKEIFQAISAKADGEPCCDWVGDEGAGHYVKMVHNGIEYGDMQLISESYALLRHGLGLSSDALQSTFYEWNQGDLDSYLIEITSQILGKKDEDGELLLDKILDVAGQKGTGKWTVINALDLGMPLTLIGEAVFARCLSALKEERIAASKIFKAEKKTFTGTTADYIGFIRHALFASKIISYAQGFMLMRQAAKEYGWKLNYGAVALMWRGGCIIRSRFLSKIKEAYDQNKELQNLLLDPYFAAEIQERLIGLRKTVILGAELGIALPCISTALAFFDGYKTFSSSANLLQALRDYFGAHTYERIDRPRGEFFHTNWTGKGGNVHSGSYDA